MRLQADRPLSWWFPSVGGSRPALPAAAAAAVVPLWNLWMTLETGRPSLKTEPGSGVIVCHTRQRAARTHTLLHTATGGAERARRQDGGRGQRGSEQLLLPRLWTLSVSPVEPHRNDLLPGCSSLQ